MRVLARMLVGCGLTALAVPTVLVGSAAAASSQTVKPAVLQSNWFWHQATTDQLAGTPAQGAVPEPSGVPAGDLGLAITDPSSGAVSKEPYLAFDLTGATSGATISDFSFTLPLDAAATQLNSGTIPLKACLPTRLWTNNPEGGSDWSQKPGDDCTTSVKGTYDSTKQAYTFKVPTYGQAWLGDVNTGVAILPDEYTQPFQLAFSGAKAVIATMTYTPSTPLARLDNNPQPAAAAPAPAAVPAVGSMPASPVTMPDVATGAAPAPAAQAPVVAGALPATYQPVARAIAGAATAPTPGFWIAGVVLALMLVATSLVLGDAEWAFTTGVRASRLDRLLRSRGTARNPVTLSLTHVPDSPPTPA